MPVPNPFPCGGPNQPPCPPVDTAPVRKYGQASYAKGRADVIAAVTAILDDPSHGWGDGEMARAVRAALAGSGQ